MENRMCKGSCRNWWLIMENFMVYRLASPKNKYMQIIVLANIESCVWERERPNSFWHSWVLIHDNKNIPHLETTIKFQKICCFRSNYLHESSLTGSSGMHMTFLIPWKKQSFSSSNIPNKKVCGATERRNLINHQIIIKKTKMLFH